MAVTRIEEGGLGTDSFNLPVTLNGTDGSSSNAGDNIVLDASASGVDAGERLLYNGIPPDFANISNDTSVLSGVTLTIDSGATIVNSGTATGFGSNEPTSADGQALGSTSAEWSDLYLADGGVIYFGNDQEVKLTHSADSGLLLKHTATADDKPINLVLQTGETDMAANDVIGKISFQAPDEGTGTDAILVSGAIQAVAEGDHSSSSNATRLEFMTGSSEAATSQMTVTSGGIVGIGAVPIGDLGVGLHIKTSDTGGSVSANSDELVLEGAGNAGVTILSQNDSVGQISFGDGDATQPGIIQYAHGTNRLEFYTNGTKHMQIDSTGAITKPLQPATFTKLQTTMSNISTGSTHAIAWGTEVYDQNGDMSAANFTAPVTGLYLVCYSLWIENIDTAASNYQIGLIASNRSHYNVWSGAAYAADHPYMTKTGSWVVDMDASDTFNMFIYQADGTAQTDISATTGGESFMTVTLVA